MSESWLILETSGRGGQVGVAVAGRLVGSIMLDAGKRHNRDLMPSAATLLADAGVSVRELTGVMVSHGPGSFTGLRVGIMTAKTLAYALGCRLVAVPTFQAIAVAAPAEFEVVEVISDALQGQVYRQRFGQADEHGFRMPLDELRILPLVEWVKQLPSDVAISGPGLDVYDQSVPQAMRRIDPAFRQPKLEAVLQVGLRTEPATAEQRLALEPIYLRGSSAEEKLAASRTTPT